MRCTPQLSQDATFQLYLVWWPGCKCSYVLTLCRSLSFDSGSKSMAAAQKAQEEQEQAELVRSRNLHA